MRATGKPIKARFERPKVDGGGGALIPVLVVLGLLLPTGLLIVLRVRTSNANANSSEVAE